MKEIIDMLILRRNRLDKLESVVIRRLQDVPDGQLRISSRNGNLQFYCRSCPSDRTGKYIKKGDTLLPAKLAQKEYDIQVLRAIKKEKQHIDKLIDSSSSLKAEDIYNDMKNYLIKIDGTHGATLAIHFNSDSTKPIYTIAGAIRARGMCH